MATQKFPESGVIADAVAAYIMGTDDAPYSDETGAAEGTIIALLKAIYLQLVAINTNTAT